ncbi:hypothetical protein AHAS_Ahas15G0143300 [Arachis hypogaea]
MYFGTLEDARTCYYRYAAWTGFALHCNKDDYCTSCIKAPKRKKIISSTNCKACCYVALDRMNGQWRICCLELSHTHSLNSKLSDIFQQTNS